MKINMLTALILAVSASTAFSAPTAQDSLENQPYFNQTQEGFDLVFNDKNYRSLEVIVNGEKIAFRAFEKIVYVKNPIAPDYQTINFYVPEVYFHDGVINGFTAKTAPIFLPNAIGGYMPAKAATYEQKSFGSTADKPNAIVMALSKGYVVASVGARGRTLEKDGKYIGKAPAAIIDLKSAVRYLHFNDERMVGDANKIISNGTSAGGALSALLGASGEHIDYADEFEKIGAAQASDAIFAVSAYCPITNLEYADMAYEWEFNGLTQFSRMDMSRLSSMTYNDRSQAMPKIEGELSAEQIQLSDELKAAFPQYVNSLNLKNKNGELLLLDAQGNGTFKDYLKSVIVQAADMAYKNGTDLSDKTWLVLDKDGVRDMDWDAYIHSEKRMKSPPAFDAFDLSSGENNLFGTELVNNQHFTQYSFEHSTQQGGMAEARIIKMMNAMNYLDNPKAAQYWRIRVGTRDRDTSHAISAILAIKLQMLGKTVDYATPWNIPHAGDYDLEELFNWADSITRESNE